MVGHRKARPTEAVLADLEDAADVAGELVNRGKLAWNGDRLLRLAGEAVIGRLADAANRLPPDVRAALPDVPWDDIRDIRILVDHIYHRIDYDALWKTLEEDVPFVRRELRAWKASRRRT